MSGAEEGFLFTSESVTEGHPDKVADQISDAIVDAALAQDASSRVAVETLLTTGLVVLAGEITTAAVLDFAAIARQVERWRFAHPSQDDRDRHAAVMAAARHIRQHSECLASAAARRDPLRVAVLAIAVHEAFLQGGTRASGRESSDRAVARAVVAANEKLFGDC